ncbi:glycosyltransferase family protein [Gracilinema caldarium]|uniref:Glycosyltransferase n=1 Tax=Gracilinema caldarium (strain ATCC 51460 / DSM 7334 / H1) TaxID=744872 RepID=F8EXN0_GRAC1|nr:glycosyltransferase [Gracilinema caldarium]AEJ19611.1 hypothetical protein Spica_1467 [Gracilinema caldarium DSM 7334]
MSNITVLTLVDRIATFYSLKPFIFFGGSKRFTFTSDPVFCLKKDKNNILIMVRQFIKPDIVDLELMKNLRKKYEVIAFFHDDAGGGIPRLEVLPYVNLFYQKALFKDINLYKKRLYGKELYSDYYHTKYAVQDKEHKERAIVEDDAQLNKLRLSWNIGIGDYPREQFRQRFGTALAKVFGPSISKHIYSRKKINYNPVDYNKGIFQVHARLGLTGRPSIAYQRYLILNKIKNDPRFLIGEVSQKQYNYETKHSKMILSPFGWGELCLRDFEAVRAGSVLLKPDMGHLLTWPDIFIPFETYVPFSWDVDDLLDKVDAYLGNDQARKQIAYNAWDVYRDQMNQLENRFESIIGEICSCTTQ